MSAADVDVRHEGHRSIWTGHRHEVAVAAGCLQLGCVKAGRAAGDRRRPLVERKLVPSVVDLVDVLDRIRRSSVLGPGDGCAETEVHNHAEKVRVTPTVISGVVLEVRSRDTDAAADVVPVGIEGLRWVRPVA